MNEHKLPLNAARLEDLLAAGIDLPSARDLLGFRDARGGFQSWAEVEGAPSVDYRLIEVLKAGFYVDEEAQPTALI